MHRYLLLIVVALVGVILQYPQFHSISFWDVSLIQQGGWWRILTGNFTHTNWPHLAMNMAALGVMVYLFTPATKSLTLLLILLSFCVGLSLMLSDIGSYAGLSGVLHGIFAYYALTEALQGRRSSWLLVIGVIAKIGYEQVFGAAGSTAELINARVAIEAHLAGGLSGLSLAIILFLYKKRPSAS